MQIIVNTWNSPRFLRTANTLLREQGKSGQCLDTLSGQEGPLSVGQMLYTDLSETQFCALEDTAVRMGLDYDARQLPSGKGEVANGS